MLSLEVYLCALENNNALVSLKLWGKRGIYAGYDKNIEERMIFFALRTVPVTVVGLARREIMFVYLH